MFFLRIMQAPVIVTWGTKILSIPKFTLDDAVAWGAEIQASRDDKATSGMNDLQKREFFNMYPSIPPDINQLRQLLLGIDASKRIVTSCLKRATVRSTDVGQELPGLSVDDIASIISLNGPARLHLLARQVSDLYEDLSVDPNLATGSTTGATSAIP